MRPTETLEACIAAHDRLLSAVAKLDDDGVRVPSLLPGWSRAHVVVHLARNADSHVWLFEGAKLGEVRHQYPSPGMREADIEAGSSRPADALIEYLTRSCHALEEAWAGLDDNRWEVMGIVTPGPRTMAEIVFRRLREVEVHHADLGVAYSPSDWATVYVEEELRRRLPSLPDRADRPALVGWLLGREEAPVLRHW